MLLCSSRYISIQWGAAAVVFELCVLPHFVVPNPKVFALPKDTKGPGDRGTLLYLVRVLWCVFGSTGIPV